MQESALISDAVSVSNAVGFWQFKDFTAIEMGLRVDKEVDERMNIVAASRGAARYIKGQLTGTKNFDTVNGDGISYVVPQHVTVSNLDKDLTFYMRVRGVFADSVVNAYIGDEKIATKKAPKFVPAEMVNFKIKKEVLEKYPDGEIKFVVEPKEAK